MPLTTNTKVWKILSVIGLLLTAIFFVCFFFETIFLTIVIGYALIMISEKISEDYKRRMKRYKLSRKTRQVIGWLLLIFWIAVGFHLAQGSVIDFTSALQAAASEEGNLPQAIISGVQEYIPLEYSERFLNQDILAQISSRVLIIVRDILGYITTIVVNGLLIIPLLFYIHYRRRNEMVAFAKDLVPTRYNAAFVRASKRIRAYLHDFFSAKITESVIVGSICCLGFYVAGIDGWLIFGLLAGFLNIIPFIGPIIGAIPPLLVGLLQSPTIGLYVLITVLVAQLVDNFYLLPFMISGKVRLDPMLSILLVLIGARLLGLLGMVFAIPIYLVYKTVLHESYVELVKIYKAK